MYNLKNWSHRRRIRYWNILEYPKPQLTLVPRCDVFSTDYYTQQFGLSHLIGLGFKVPSKSCRFWAGQNVRGKERGKERY